jgi:hypothetical protein
VCAASNIRVMMEAARTSETSVDDYITRQYIPEDKYELHVVHVNLPIVHVLSLTKLECVDKNSETFSTVKFHENKFIGSRNVTS